MAALREFQVKGLYGDRNIEIPITDNRLILVGENGTGKSTISNLIYLFLTGQWIKMANYKFISIKALIDDIEIVINHSDISMLRITRSKKFPSRYIAMAERFTAKSKISEEDYRNPTLREVIIENFGRSERLSSSLAEDVMDEYMNFNVGEANSKRRSTLIKLRRYSEIIKEAFCEQILFLPTYRRIEQELSKIFPDVDTDIGKFRRLYREDVNFVEFIEFGMDDVHSLIVRKINEIKESIRNDLNTLTSKYLLDIIDNKYDDIDMEVIKNIDIKSIDDAFQRFDKTILPESQQDRLRYFLEQIKGEGVIREKDKIIAHFLMKLIYLNQSQEEVEKDISKLADICNNYFYRKKMVYDRSSFHFFIRRVDENQEFSGDEINLQDLSSGEKQIVSLFAHLLLSGKEKFFLIIDEPELSLSVTWQKRFLADMIDTKKTVGLIAVTHSPFIFNNELGFYAHDMSEFEVGHK